MPQTKEQSETEKSISMILDPYSWPNWPALPLKKRITGQLPEVATLSLPINGKYILFHENLYALIHSSITEPVKTTEYHSVEAIMADGWVVD